MSIVSNFPSSVELPYMTRVTLSASNWNAGNLTQTVEVAGILADETAQSIEVSPYNKTNSDIILDAGIYCSSQSTNALVFTCESIPTSDVVVVVKWQDIEWIEP